MQRPFILIDGKLTERTEFDITHGVQPTSALFYLKEGEFSLSLNGKKCIIKAGDTVIFNQTQEFVRSVKSKIVFVYIKFRINENCKFYPKIPFGKIEFKDKERFLSSITAYEKALATDDIFSLYYREHLFEDILFQIAEENSSYVQTKISDFDDNVVKTAVDFINENISKHFTINDLAKKCATNPSTLNFRFRRALNISTWQYVTIKRVEKAKQLLKTTSYSIGEIALKCGFDNAYYFSTAFKKIEKVSPKNYRNNFGIL